MKRIICFFTVAAIMCLSLGGCGEQMETAAWIDVTGIQSETYNGRTVTFTSDGHCALWSPYDSYSISAADDGQFILSIIGILGGNPQYTVKMIDNDTIDLYLGGEVEFKLSRTGGGGW